MSYLDVLAHRKAHNLVLPISVAQYHDMMVAGFIPEKTELIEGIIFRKMAKSPLHEYLAQTLFEFFQTRLDERYLLRKEAPLTLRHSEPEPDISIVQGKRQDFFHVHPQSAELVIEIAVSSVELDRAKADVYAAAQIADYWIILAKEKLLERYSNPMDGHYQTMQRFSKQDTLDTLCGPLLLEQLF